MLPREAPPKRRLELRTAGPIKNAGEYSPIANNNIFHVGKIPPPLASAEGEINIEVAAVPSQLPIELMGTIVHANPARSLATILVKPNPDAKSYRVGEEIPGLARITKVERRKVTFINLQSKKHEYKDIPVDFNISFNFKDGAADAVGVQDGPVLRKSETEFAVKRTDLDSYTRDLPSLLKDARMTPNIVPGGGVEGFRFVWIKPGSIYEKLGLKPGDVVKGVNNEEINDPKKAFQAYQSLRDSDGIVLNVIRDGREQRISYSITN